jgi:predicted O-methyltransferase YrrM
MGFEPKYYRRFDYDRALLPNAYVAAMERDVRDLDTAKRKTGLTIGYPGWNLLYYALACSLHPQEENIVVETGTNFGFSTIMMAQALKDSRLPGHVHTIELDPANVERARANVREAGVADLVTVYAGDAKEVLRDVAAALAGPIRFAFLDGSHHERDVLTEFAIVHARLAENGVVMFDNTYRRGQPGEPEQWVHGALHAIQRQYGGNLINFPNTSWCTPGQALWQKTPFPASQCAAEGGACVQS